ncbi:SigE-dependent sporulation protein [Oceanobacillus zhaokaii]|uniref:SigE-dependent sporulation protein n=1 Tax=Oceanobacillus zhaokaii TaxID=2052660 RepID=A0A345PFC5_9BACI|nr:sporulation YhaL family protein [Oceanobacillus zhaokaii]AXI08705.1 SigE-dependent sporulation protein [Oceanobacillus zhaokaii]
MIAGIPWWVIVVIALIFVSAYMAFKARLAESRLEQQFIEREGRIYIERIESEREARENRKRELSN